MKLHKDQTLFEQAVTLTAQRIGLLEIYVEKDYWVTYALHKIFNSGLKEKVVFKGGTALAKCYTIIERFSEDIDMVLLRAGDETANQLKKQLKSISDLINEDMPEVERAGITNKMGMIRKTAHNYPKLFEGLLGQVRNDIILETGWLGSYEPYENRMVSCYMYEMMQQNNQEDLIAQFDLSPFPVLSLSPKRTICEKIMSLVRFSNTQTPIIDLNNKIRHIYDLYKLLSDEELHGYFHSSDFDTMLLKVAQEDRVSFKNNNEWLKSHPKEALIFSDTENTWQQLKNTYLSTFKSLVYGDFPQEDAILKTLQDMRERIGQIKWL